MNIPSLRELTCARVGLGRTGDALRTAELLQLQLAHARARQAVHSKLDAKQLAVDLAPYSPEVLIARSAVSERATYLRRPDLGRRVEESSRSLLLDRKGSFDAVIVVVDGLSAVAVERHATPLIAALLKLLDPAEWSLAPTVIVEQGRVAIGDEIGDCLGAALSIVLIGERPGLSSPDSLGVYLTWNPKPGLTDVNRNCISNIREEGLSYALAAHKLAFLMRESRQRRLSGVELKENATADDLQISGGRATQPSISETR